MNPIVIIVMAIVLLIPINVVFGIESFVDTTKDPQSYIDRYNNEPIYKEWFDTNYPNTTIYDAVGIKEPDLKKIPEWVRNTFVWYAENKISESELLSTIEFLVNENIITINLPQNSNNEKEAITIEEYSQQENTPNKTLQSYLTGSESSSQDDSNYSDDFQSILWTRDDIGEKWIVQNNAITNSNSIELDKRLSLQAYYPVADEWRIQSQIDLWNSNNFAQEHYMGKVEHGKSITFSNFSQEDDCVTYEKHLIDAAYRERISFIMNCVRDNITYFLNVEDLSAYNDLDGITVYDIGNELQLKIEEKLNKIRLP